MKPALPRGGIDRAQGVPAPIPAPTQLPASMPKGTFFRVKLKNFTFFEMSDFKIFRKNEANQFEQRYMMNLVLDKSITETPELTGQFMVFPNGFGSGDAAFSRMSREQLAAFLNAESSNAQSGHFVTSPAEPTPPTPEKGLAVGVLKQAAYDLRCYRTATKAA